MTNGDRYRRGVGVMLLNAQGKVFVGARIDNTDEAWQMPQGGVDPGEDTWEAAKRELYEETSVRSVEKLGEAVERAQQESGLDEEGLVLALTGADS